MALDLSFPDQTYTLSNKPSVATLKNDLTALEAAHNTISGDLVGTTDTQTLSNKTMTAPVLNGNLSGSAFNDEDDMSSDSATAAASQQSIKAYIDNHMAILRTQSYDSVAITTHQTYQQLADISVTPSGVDSVTMDILATYTAVVYNDNQDTNNVFKAYTSISVNGASSFDDGEEVTIQVAGGTHDRAIIVCQHRRAGVIPSAGVYMRTYIYSDKNAGAPVFTDGVGSLHIVPRPS